jgi:phosphoglycolate phosphatase
MPHRLVIFDFDGTLADSFPWFIDAFDQAAQRYRFDRPDRSRIDELRDLDARQIMARHRIAPWKVPFVARFLRDHMAREIGRISLFPGVGAALETLIARGLSLALLSSNSYRNVTQVLGNRTRCFRDLECSASLFGKTTRLRRLVAASGMAAHEVIFVGDEIRDAEAARRVGVAFGAVTWGYTGLGPLAAHGPAITFYSVEELVTKLAPHRPTTGSGTQEQLPTGRTSPEA